MNIYPAGLFPTAVFHCAPLQAPERKGNRGVPTADSEQASLHPGQIRIGRAMTRLGGRGCHSLAGMNRPSVRECFGSDGAKPAARSPHSGAGPKAAAHMRNVQEFPWSKPRRL
jgi:hypothetical protein